MNRRLGIMDRVLARVRHEPPPEHLSHLGPCWIWEGPTSGEHDGTRATRGHGYPRMCLDGQTVAVHRVTCTHEHGYLPSRRQVDHLCRRRLCVAPLHMEPVTHRRNQIRRSEAAGRMRSAPQAAEAPEPEGRLQDVQVLEGERGPDRASGRREVQ